MIYDEQARANKQQDEQAKERTNVWLTKAR